MVFCLRWNSLTITLFILDVAEADQKRGHILSHLLVKCQALLLKSGGDLLDVNASLERVLTEIILEAVDQLLLVDRELGAKA